MLAITHTAHIREGDVLVYSTDVYWVKKGTSITFVHKNPWGQDAICIGPHIICGSIHLFTVVFFVSSPILPYSCKNSPIQHYWLCGKKMIFVGEIIFVFLSKCCAQPFWNWELLLFCLKHPSAWRHFLKRSTIMWLCSSLMPTYIHLCEDTDYGNDSSQ